MSFCKKLIKTWVALRAWLYVQIFGWMFYDKKYLQGKWFSNGIYSEGWKWAARDIHYRLRTLKHLQSKYPVAPEMVEVGANVHFDLDDLDLMNAKGNYYQTIDGNITIGKGTRIANNVGIITTNHDFLNLEKHQPGKDVVLGEQCWIGMNSMILPGVVLGPHTVVGAGSVVTHSFEDGYCIIAGNPARKIKDLTCAANSSDMSEKER